MYRPPTRRAFLSPGDALEVRTRVSAADCRDVAPDQLRYEKLVLQHCSFFVEVEVVSFSKLHLPPFPSSIPFLSFFSFIPSRSLPPLPPPVFQYCTFLVPSVFHRASSVLLAGFQFPCNAAFNCCRKGS
jgi:hypothetical protein